jgi:hypothetical protein
LSNDSLKIPAQKPSVTGVTLLEIIIAFFILAVAGISASSLISHGHRATKADFRQGEALQILVDRMNALSILPFSKFKTALGAGGGTRTINSTFEDIEFSDSLTIGSNNYSVTAEISYQSVTFDNLMQLKFPNPKYVPDNPKTWHFQYKSPRTESFNSISGDNAFGVVKLVVTVRPIDGERPTERSVTAMTFVCNTEE